MKKVSQRKVALIQNRIQPGGRFQVMAEMILVLNEMGIEPEILCFRSRLTHDSVQNYYEKNLRFTVQLIKPEPPMPFEWNIWWFNKRVSAKLRDYHLVINHNNTSFGLKTETPLISYVHFPRKARLRSGLRSIHEPEQGRPPFWNTARDFLNLMRRCYKRDRQFLPNEKLVANSEFTKQNLLDFYPNIKPEEVEVLHPPVMVKPKKLLGNKKRQVVSLARFTPAKRQMEQIEVAAALPHLQFYLVGFKANHDYYQNCRELIEKRNIKNVELLSNISSAKLQEVLRSSWFFMHSMQNEPYGITPVQGILAGCIPVVHDSGGQREIVCFSELRYNSINEAVTILEELSEKDDQELKSRSDTLVQHVQKFSPKAFQERFGKMMLNLLP